MQSLLLEEATVVENVFVPGVNASYNCKGDNNGAGVPCSAVSPVTQDPYIQVKGGALTANSKATNGASILSLALKR